MTRAVDESAASVPREAPSAWAMLESDPEVGHVLHEKLRIAAGLRLLPHRDGVAILGGTSTELFSGHGVRSVLARVLPLLDGNHTVDELVRECADLEASQVHDVVGNLFMGGLLRTDSAPAADSEIEMYLDRFVGVTGVHGSGGEAAAALRASTLGLFAPPEIARWITEIFLGDEGGDVVLLETEDDVRADIDLLLVVCVLDSSDPTAVFERACRLGVPALNLEMSGERFRCGPFVLPRTSAGYACYTAAHERVVDLDSSRDTLAEQVWCATATHLAVSILSGTAKRLPINAFIDLAWRSGRQVERRTTIARLHGWSRDGSPIRLGLARGMGGYEGWKQYCGIALQTPEWHPSNSYLMHFKTENILSIFERAPSIHSETSIRLQASTTSNVPSGRLTRDRLTLLLTNAAGFARRDGVPRRVVPTGGNLGSTLVLVLVLDIEGIQPGAYWFDGQAAQLECMTGVDVKATLSFIGIDTPAAAVVITFANVLKVARKYGAFSINIGWYDSGVLLAYVRNLADALGLGLVDHARPDATALMRHLCLPDSSILPTGVLELQHGAAQQGGCTGEILVAAIEKRRAVREWPVNEVDFGTVTALCASVDEALVRHQRVAGLDVDVSLLMLLKLSDGEDGFYEYVRGGTLVLIAACQRTEHHRMLSQLRLAEAPIIVLPRIDLIHLLARGGDAGVETAYRAAGAIVGDLWLHASQLGLAGTACGGTFEGQIRTVVGRHGLEDFTPLSLCLGPVSSAAVSKSAVNP
jgi:SagB-type dehydrogenase family enzyme